MDKLANKENECEQMKKCYKELADKMQNYVSIMTKNSEQRLNEMMEKRNVENLVKFNAMEKLRQQAEAQAEADGK